MSCVREIKDAIFDADNIPAILIVLTIGFVLFMTGACIYDEITTSKQFNTYVTEHKFDKEKVKRFLDYNESMTRKDFMQDGYVRHKYQEYLNVRTEAERQHSNFVEE